MPNIDFEASRRLINMDAAIDKIATEARKRGTVLGNDDSAIPNLSPITHKPTYDGGPIKINKHSKLPKEIVESFKNNQIDVRGLGGGGSILDTMGVLPQTPPKKIIAEEAYNPQQPNNIDYSLIKSIIDESIKNYMGKYMKKMLNESVSKTSSELSAMKIGDTFNFITKDGKVYEAKLTFKKQIK